MAQSFDAFLSDIARERQLGTILYMGVDLADPAPLLALSAQRVALVLPAPMISPGLRQRAAVEERLSLHPVLVGSDSGHAQLTLYNFAALSSTRPPAQALRALFPNLRETRRIDVETQPLDSILATLPDTDVGEDVPADMLIVDLCGEEQVIADALRKMPPGARFAHLILRTGQEALYEGTLPLPRLVAQLEEIGYGIAGRNLDDPDIPCIHFQLDPRALRIGELETALAQKDTELAAAETARAELEGARDQEREGRKTAEARVTELKGELDAQDAAVKKRDADIVALEGQLAVLRANMTQTERRQRAIEDELIRAEVQIDMLRDLLKLPAPAQETTP